MSRCAVIYAIALFFAGSISGKAAAQQPDDGQNGHNSVPVSMQVDIMPPTPSPDSTTAPDIDETSPALLNEQNSATSTAKDNLQEDGTKNAGMKLVTRGIYQCIDGNRTVFVDEENRSKYRQCTQIRAPYYEQITESDEQAIRSPCSGAIVYKGSTYIFNDQEPCPIPEEIFELRKPIEANPEYYTQPTS